MFNDPLPALILMRKLGLEPDDWQVKVLEANYRRLLLNCCRQAGKSTVVAVLALIHAVFSQRATVIIVSPSHRQSKLLFSKVAEFYHRIGSPMKVRQTLEELHLSNGNCIIGLPCKDETIRGYSGVTLLLIDEASRVPLHIYKGVLPMIAASKGRMICLSTPRGKQGFFYDAWVNGGDDWARIEIPGSQCPRLSEDELEAQRRTMGEASFRQEFCCSFESVEGLVFKDFNSCVVTELPAGVEYGRKVGGIDFGFRNPFAALWGHIDADNVLWLVGERYGSGEPITDHMRFLPKGVLWHCDPSGAEPRAQMVKAGFKVINGKNDIANGIAAVAARIRARALFVLESGCPNLLREAHLYRYATEPGQQSTENPIPENNHAMDALRYLVSRLNNKLPPPPPDFPNAPPPPPPTPDQPSPPGANAHPLTEDEQKREDERRLRHLWDLGADAWTRVG